jgi:hypothetical protein
MERTRRLLLSSSYAQIGVALLIVILVLIAGFVLIDREFDLEILGARRGSRAIDVDAVIGATVETLDASTARSLRIPAHSEGLVVTSLGRTGPAARAGIEVGDVIERIGRSRVASSDEAAAALGASPPGDVILRLNRHGKYAIVHLPIRLGSAQRDPAREGVER